MIAIVDYGVGNLFSLKSSFEAIGEKAVVSGEPQELKAASGIILPGVGAFGDAVDKLRRTGLDRILKEEASAGKPILGICLGMQMLFDRSFEYGEHEGLGLIHGDIVPMQGKLPENLKIPHIGWNRLEFERKDCPLFQYVSDGDYMYFVHSYYADNCSEDLVASTEYGLKITAAVAHGNVYGCQFHPEKSGDKGLSILKAFCEM